MSAVPHLEIIPQFSLQGLNTLALPGHAEFFCSVTDQVEVQQALDYARQNSLPVTALGGGSNMVLAGDIAGLVIHLESTGIYCEELDDDLVHVTFAAGENWHQAVIYCLDQGWYGLENLSLIPGNMGAAPIQNIGAYGVELCDLFVSLEAVEISTGRLVVINKADCEFGYRDSIFKQAYENQYLITQVTLALSRVPKVNIHYPALAAALADQRLDQMAKDALPTPEMVSAAVCSVRRSKLPDPAQIPNAGSFFKNPVVRLELLQKLLGENWHQAVIYCLDQGWYGLENLSLIPGNMGAAPIQNIGAYGVELCDLFVSLEAVEISTGRLVVINKADCEFGYRDSIFKQAYENQYLITQVTLALSRVPKVNIHYPALAAALADQRLDQMAKDALPTPEMVSAAVCSVRRSKLPDPAQIPNAGSFFKNPVVRLELLQKLLESNPGMPHFIQSLSNQTNSNQTNSNQPHSNQPHSNQTPPNREHSSQSLASAKIPAAWLIDQCGFRGLRSGNVAVHEHQALVLVNFGGTGTELLGLAAEIQAKVQARFSIALEIEPRVYGSATS